MGLLYFVFVLHDPLLIPYCPFLFHDEPFYFRDIDV